MQSRVAATAAEKLNRIFLSAAENQTLMWRRLSSASSIGRTAADPAFYQGGDNEDAKVAAVAILGKNQTEHKPSKEKDPFLFPKLQPVVSYPKVRSNEVSRRTNPITQQKRRNTTSAGPTGEVSCTGLDGSPWPEETVDRRTQRKEQEADDREYFKHHKASPLSEIEVADTRKPITRATSGTADSYYSGGGEGVILWRPEQVDTAEDSLRRAVEIWKQNATRGDPESPHGRVLRALRGEYW